MGDAVKRRRLIDQGKTITMSQRSVCSIRNPNGTRDVFLMSVGGVCTCHRFIRKPRAARVSAGHNK